jgi:hypothetical protein
LIATKARKQINRLECRVRGTLPRLLKPSSEFQACESRIELAAGDCAQRIFFHESIEQENEDEMLPVEGCDHLLRKIEE